MTFTSVSLASNYNSEYHPPAQPYLLLRTLVLLSDGIIGEKSAQAVRRSLKKLWAKGGESPPG